MYEVVSKDELYHYGIKGQKWGIRRFQNPDGTLTAEGKARYSTDKDMKKAARKEVRADNKKAYELGRKATIDSHASYIADKKALKAQVRYEKNPTNRRLTHLEAKQKTAERLDERAKESKRAAEEHISELISKYGSQAVKELRIDSKGRVSEKVNNGKDWVKGLGASAVGGVIGFMALPVAAIATTGVLYDTALPFMAELGNITGRSSFVAFGPKSKGYRGKKEYHQTLREEEKAQRSLH